MESSFSFTSIFASAGDWLRLISAEARGMLELSVAEAAARYPDVEAYLPQMFDACILLLALAVLLLARRTRRDRRALRGLIIEAERQRSELDALTAFRVKAEERLARVYGDIADIAARQRGVEARVGKPDPQLAAAMARAGTGSKQMVECGLSHGEVHLLNALSAGHSPAGDGTTADACAA